MSWIPDTCGCVLEFSSGGNNPDHFTHVSKKCEAHKNKTSDQIKVDVFGENQNKNKAIKKLIETLPELSKTDERGNVIPDLDKISFEHDANRKLILKCKGINTDKESRKNSARNEIEKEIGANKAEIVAL